MEQNIWKNAFKKLELTEETKERAWEVIVKKDAERRGNPDGMPGREKMGRKRFLPGRWAVAAVACSFLLGIVLIHIQTEGKFAEVLQRMWKVDKPSQEVVEQTVSFQFDSRNAPELIECSEERLIFASAMGLIVYDRGQRRVVGTIDLKEIGCFYMEEDSIMTRFLPEGDRLTIYNHESGKKARGNCYIYDLAECRSLEKGEVKALEPGETVPVTSSLEKRWKKMAKKSQRNTYENKIYVNFRDNMEREGKIILGGRTISWNSEKGEKYYSCLAFRVLDSVVGKAGKRECCFILYSKNRDTGELEKESVKLKVYMPDTAEEDKLPAYEYRTDDPIKKALADCAKDNLRLYIGSCYGAGKLLDFNYPEDMPILPVISIYEVREGRKYTKVYGEFIALGLNRSGNVLYDAYIPYFPADGYGCAYLKKTADGYTVKKIVHPNDGSVWPEQMLAMCDGDKKLLKKVEKAHKNCRRDSLKMVEEYVSANGLDIRYFKWDGGDLVKLGEMQ